ncbi:MFS general substrate transporter [Diplocarpon rosae]|nr:MFS general substrate transporter [Diplocarpon rosae]
MPDRDPERDANYHSRNSDLHSSSSSSEPIESYSEQTPLLFPAAPAPDYRSTSPNSTSEDPERQHEDDEPLLATETKSLVAIISLLMIGVFMSNADGSLVLATFGTVSSEFGALGDASLLTTSYSLATCAVQPISSKLSDIYGRKAVLLVSYVLFGLGSVICGLGQSMWQVISGRIVAGTGAAGMTVIVSILITDLVPMIQVASWRSYVNVVSTFGRSIGGPLGGLLADTVGWRWSFLGQAPPIALAILLVALRLSSHTGYSHSNSRQKYGSSKLRRIDFIGAIFLALTIVSLLGALSLGGQSLAWTHPLILALFASSLVLGTAFIVYEKKVALEPVFPPSLMVQRDVATNYAIIALQSAAQLAMIYSVPLYFRVTQNSSNTAAGSHLFPAVLGNTLGGLLSGLYIQRTGRYKALAILATLCSSFSYLLLIVRWTGETNWLESLEIVPGGFGMGIAFSATFIGLQSVVNKKDSAIATGGQYLWSGVGTVVGLAGASAVQIGSLRALLTEGLSRVPDAASVISAMFLFILELEGLLLGDGS